MTTSASSGTGPADPTGPTENSMRRALKRARDGVALDAAEAAVLPQARGEHLDALTASAARVRDAGLEAAGRPGVITYSKSVFVPLTRLCRDKCHYCTFVTVPGKLRRAGHGMFMSPDEVLDIARKGAALGCKEALITLGDKPEDRWPEAREWLDAHGYDDTIAYVRAISIRILEETGLLPHLNPGVMTWTDFQRLKPVAPSMGMMLETTATRLSVRARRPAPRLARQGARRTAARPGGRRALLGALHLRHPHRHRRTSRSGPSPSSRCAASPAPTTASRN
ncbi:7,8-didemethyl-8-hydroxy-5-deazariboflavin synthase [Streptomyces tendae]